VKKGSDYALIVKDKVYTLKANDATKADLDKLAGKMAKIVGDLTGETIQVTSVQAAKKPSAYGRPAWNCNPRAVRRTH
jgi:hypothetical protein